MTVSPGPEALITLSGLYKIYGQGEAEVRALDGIELTIHNGEFLAIMGPSGSGKSTAMNIIGLLDRPTSGHHLFAGTEVGSLARSESALIRRNFLGFIFQGYNLLPRISAVENVELPLIYRGMPAAQRRRAAIEALARVGLSGREHHQPSQLSGGQQQRVAIARAVAGSPAVILADEPTGNLDTATSIEIMDLLTGLNRDEGITVVMVTHEPDMAEYATRLVRFRDGRIEDDGNGGGTAKEPAK